MSILIKGMEMPGCCGGCLFYGLESAGDGMYWDYCRYNCVPIEDPYTGRRSDCPLVYVPPHGDLIDRNKLYNKTADWEAQALYMVEATANDEKTTQWRKWTTVLTERSAFKFDVADAPTIIPAEGGE